MKPPKDKKLMADMCERFCELMNVHLQIDKQQMALALNYDSLGTINKVQKHKSFVDVERLIYLAELKNKNGATPNLNWLVTGKGDPLIFPDPLQKPKCLQDAESALINTSPQKLKAIIKLIT